MILATVVRSASSLAKYGPNASLLLRPDAAIFVVHTTLGFLITYSLATDPHSHVYVPHFVGSSANISRRRQSHAGAGWIGVVGPSSSLDTSGGGTVGISPGEELMLGPGEGAGARDASVRFRMVIKVDAGIGAALALDDELVVATHRPAAVQCIRWTPDSKGGQTSTELLGRMTWMQQNDSQGAGAGAASQARKKVAITEMTHDRPMNLATWVTTDGRAYAVQRIPPPRDTDEKEGEAGDAAVAEDKPHQAPRPPPEQKKRPLFRGHCFHVPSGNDGDAGDAAVRATVNARFSLIAVGCVDGCVRVYTARDYAGNIAPSHMHRLPDGVSRTRSGRLTCLAYSPDGHCLFAGYEKGWATWSVYGKPGAHAFAGEASVAEAKGETWLEGGGVREAVWIGGGCELLVVGGRSDALWVMEMARSSVTGCYGPANLFRTILHTSTDIMVYRGYDLPDLSSISAEPFLWHTAGIPPGYLLRQWPVRCVAVSPDGRYVAVAGRRGLVHYSVASGRWKTFGSEVALENEFQVRGGMTWYQHILVAAVETTAAVASPTDGSTHMVRVHELRLFSRETALDSGIVMYAHRLPSPVVLLAPSGEDALLVYTHDNILRHFRVVPVVLRGTGARAGNGGGAMRLVEVGRVGLHDVVRSPPRVRGLSWLVPDGQLLEGDPAMDAATASALFLVDGKLVLLRPTVDETAVDPDAAEGSTGFVKVRYDMRHMRVVAHNVEFHVCMRDLPLALVQQLQLRLLQDDDDRASVGAGAGAPAASVGSGALGNSLWIFDGNDVKMWPDVHLLLNAAAADGPSRELPPVVTVPIDFYPLSVLLGKGTVLGLEPDLVQRRDINFSYFRFTIRVSDWINQMLLSEVLAADRLIQRRPTSSSQRFSASTFRAKMVARPSSWGGNTGSSSTSPMRWRCSSTRCSTRRSTRLRRPRQPCSRASSAYSVRSPATSMSWSAARAKRSSGRGAPCLTTSHRRRSSSRSRSSGVLSRQPAGTCSSCTHLMTTSTAATVAVATATAVTLPRQWTRASVCSPVPWPRATGSSARSSRASSPRSTSLATLSGPSCKCFIYRGMEEILAPRSARTLPPGWPCRRRGSREGLTVPLLARRTVATGPRRSFLEVTRSLPRARVVRRSHEAGGNGSVFMIHDYKKPLLGITYSRSECLMIFWSGHVGLDIRLGENAGTLG